jgi:4,4'-diaponeurosporenoate glycosyltransferase
MIGLAVFCLLGIPAGFLLLWRLPTCGSHGSFRRDPISIVIPARNEEANLPRLLASIRSSAIQPAEVLVVDDASTDATAALALAGGAKVIHSKNLPSGWTGKTWACHRGAIEADADILLFLDADTYFSPDGYPKMADAFFALGDATSAMSVLPYHAMKRPYEELSLFFNLLMAMGAGGFGLIGDQQLFGQSLIIARDLLSASGGHQAVSAHILENLALASKLKSAGGRSVCFVGRGTLNMRMFPNGLAQLCEGWTKAFADGAAASSGLVLIAAVFWLTALSSCFLSLLLAPGLWRATFGILYLGFVSQLFLFARQIGNFNPLTCLLYPIPLFFYFGLFAQSLYRKLLGRKVSWRGRTI